MVKDFPLEVHEASRLPSVKSPRDLQFAALLHQLKWKKDDVNPAAPEMQVFPLLSACDEHELL